MMELPRVKIINEGEGCLGTKCYIENHEIKSVKSFDFHQDTKTVSCFTFETNGFPDIDTSGSIRFCLVPETVEESVKVIQNELKKHGELYNGFLASIRIAIRDSENEIYDNELSEKILKRIIGEE